MQTKKLMLAMLTGLVALSVQAQTDVENWLENKRPDCSEWHLATEDAMPTGQRKIGSQTTAPMKARGVQHVPLVLVAFKDVDFSVADTELMDADGKVVGTEKGTDEQLRTYYNLFCNGTMDGKLYRGHGSYGSVRDYFVAMSDSVFLPEFTPIGPVRLDMGAASWKNGICRHPALPSRGRPGLLYPQGKARGDSDYGLRLKKGRDG